MTAYSDGSLYLSRFNGDTNEIYRLRKDADGSYEAVLSTTSAAASARHCSAAWRPARTIRFP